MINRCAEIGFDDTGIVLHDIRTVAGDDLAVIEHGDRIGQRHDQIDMVFDQQDRDAQPGNPADHGFEIVDLLRRQSGGGFVEQQQARLASQRTRDLEPALQSERQEACFIIGVF